MNQKKCIIIGGGISGLMAGTVLQRAGFLVTVLDMGRGIGGRIATRRIKDDQYGEGVFDYGAQFFTARDPLFQSWVNRWLEQNLVQKWSDGFLTRKNELKKSGEAKYRGVVSNRDIAKRIAVDLDVHTRARVIRIAWEENQWKIITEGNQFFQSDLLMMTLPVPQILELLTTSDIELSQSVKNRLEKVSYRRCIALLLLLKAKSRIPEPGGIWLDGDPISWIADNTVKGISPNGHALTIHLGHQFSLKNWKTEDELILNKIQYTAKNWIKAEVAKYQIHRWKYSQPVTFFNDPYLHVQTPGNLILSGDGFIEGRVEGAALSGIKAAEYIISQM
ncbi:MAG: FAD-dependent oxidoreductase [bacterium]|nr:MAG: FAD-dependent oxidoreductase [bacterium]